MEFTCECCHYATTVKCNYDKHISSNKHIIQKYKQTTAFRLKFQRQAKNKQKSSLNQPKPPLNHPLQKGSSVNIVIRNTNINLLYPNISSHARNHMQITNILMSCSE